MTRYTEISRTLASNPRRWLVTGAAGFIGSALVERLIELGQQVVGLDNFSTGHQRNIDEATAAAKPGQFELVEGDISDLETCRAACLGIDVVLHQAALGSVPASLEDPLSTHRSNVTGFLNILLAARDREIRRVVYASSSAVYGDDDAPAKDEERIGRALSPYAISKRIDELYAQIVADCYRLPIVGLRYFNVYGKRQDPNGPYAAVIPRWIDRLAAGEPVEVFGDGENSRDFCHVDDAVQANLLAALAPEERTNTVYNVACGKRTSLQELFEILRDEVARFVPSAASATPVHLDPRPGDILHSRASIDSISEALGYRPSREICDGLADTVAWFVSRRQDAAERLVG